MSDGSVLVTGATGYLGQRVARRLLAQGRRVIAPVRAAGGQSFDGRAAALQAALPGDLQVVAGDVGEDGFLAGVDLGDVCEVIHSAAVTAFNVGEPLARRVNAEGSRRVFRAAERMRKLQSLSHVSTVYACGLVDGEVPEEPFEREPQFANWYERSKHMAERALRTEHASLPWRIFRVATVMADDDTGTVTQQNAFHNTLKLFFHGLLPLVPGDENATLYLVTGDFVADALVGAATKPGDVLHVCHARGHNLSLGRLIDLAHQRFLLDGDFSARGVLRPLFCDMEGFHLLAGSIDALGGAVLAQAMASVKPFAAQLFADKDVRNERLRAAWPSYQPPDIEGTCRAVADWLVRTRFGRRT